MAEDNLVVLNCVTRLDVPAERILKAALERGLESVVVVGYDAAGEEYFASSLADGGDALWLLERCKKKLLDVPEVFFWQQPRRGLMSGIDSDGPRVVDGI